MSNMEILLIVLGVAGAFAILVIFLVRHRSRPVTMDDLEGHDFEYYCADLLAACGFHDVEVTKGSGDFGADILCRREGITYAVQCKCYDGPVGVFAVQEIYAARDYYECMVGAVMTNQYFTAPARQMAGKLRILLWDRDEISRMQAFAEDE